MSKVGCDSGSILDLPDSLLIGVSLRIKVYFDLKIFVLGFRLIEILNES